MTSIRELIIETAQKAREVKEIRSRRCFIVDIGAFSNIVDRFLEKNLSVESDVAIGAEGYDSIAVTATSADKGRYFICAESVPTLDSMWDRAVQSKSKENL